MFPKGPIDDMADLVLKWLGIDNIGTNDGLVHRHMSYISASMSWFLLTFEGKVIYDNKLIEIQNKYYRYEQFLEIYNDLHELDWQWNFDRNS